MNMMLRPPKALQRVIGWRAVLGMEAGGDSFFAQVRAAQTAMLNGQAPFNIGLLLLNLAAGLATLADDARMAALAPWIAGIAGLALLWMLRNLRMRRGGAMGSGATGSGAAPAVSRVVFWQVSAELVAFAVFWAGIVHGLMPGQGASGQALLLLSSMLVLAGTGFCCAVMPVANLLATLVIAAGALLALPAGSPLAQPMVGLAVGSLWLVVARGSLIATRAMMDRMRSEAELGEQGEVVRLLLSEFEAHGSDWLLELDPAGRLTHVTQRFADVARRPRSELMGKRLVDMLETDHADAAVAALAGAIAGRRPFRDLAVPVNMGGEIRWWTLSGTPKQDATGAFTGFRGVGRDVTEVRRGQERIAQLARFDPLTGLANRALLREALEGAVADAQRSGRPCALLLVDLDRFKAVNDALGHDAGDALLRAVAGRLVSAVRGGATIARLGGDEFAIVLPDAGQDRAARVAQRIVKALAEPFRLDLGVVQVGASVGHAEAPGDADTAEALMKCADLALYQVKGDGRGAACRFAPEIRARVDGRRALETDLAGALERGELALAFQPVVAASDEHVTAFEALLRWRHPRHGLIPPAQFIPIAEESGLIVPIGQWVIDTACAWAARWPAHIRVAVNLSPAQMEDAALVGHVEAALARNGLEPERLELEITESLFMADRPAVSATLAGLRGLGISFALDDFGTGYSSLGYLHKAAFSRIKIDRSFVQRATNEDGEASHIIRAIVRMAGALDMATTAEGTETRAEFEAIRKLGCQQVQGYLFGKPMPPEEATALANQQTRGRGKPGRVRLLPVT